MTPMTPVTMMTSANKAKSMCVLAADVEPGTQNPVFFKLHFRTSDVELRKEKIAHIKHVFSYYRDLPDTTPKHSGFPPQYLSVDLEPANVNGALRIEIRLFQTMTVENFVKEKLINVVSHKLQSYCTLFNEKPRIGYSTLENHVVCKVYLPQYSALYCSVKECWLALGFPESALVVKDIATHGPTAAKVETHRFYGLMNDSEKTGWFEPDQTYLQDFNEFKFLPPQNQVFTTLMKVQFSESDSETLPANMKFVFEALEHSITTLIEVPAQSLAGYQKQLSRVMTEALEDLNIVPSLVSIMTTPDQCLQFQYTPVPDPKATHVIQLVVALTHHDTSPLQLPSENPESDPNPDLVINFNAFQTLKTTAWNDTFLKRSPLINTHLPLLVIRPAFNTEHLGYVSRLGEANVTTLITASGQCIAVPFGLSTHVTQFQFSFHYLNGDPFKFETYETIFLTLTLN